MAEGELATLYAGAAAFAYPSSWEGFGLPGARGHGPRHAGGHLGRHRIAEVAGDAALLVDPKDPAALHDGAEPPDRGLASSPTGSATTAALRASHFTWERTAELTAAAYRDALG